MVWISDVDNRLKSFIIDYRRSFPDSFPFHFRFATGSKFNVLILDSNNYMIVIPQNRFNIFVNDHSVPLDIFLHLPNYRTQEICKIIPTNLVLTASDLCPRTLFISVPECDIGDGNVWSNRYLTKVNWEDTSWCPAYQRTILRSDNISFHHFSSTSIDIQFNF